MQTETSFLSPSEYTSYRAKQLELIATHIDPKLSYYLKAMDEDIYEAGGHGSFVYDVCGRRYFDAATGGGVFALGHAHPKIVEAVREQALKGGLSTHLSFVPKQLELLQRLSEIVPGHYTHGYIGSTGTEVGEAALRLARLTTGRSKVVSFDYSYHGMSIATIAVTGIPYCHKGIPEEPKSFQSIPYNDLKAASQALTEDVAAVIVEPIQWAAGCRAGSAEFLQGLRQLCNERGIILIFDEIQSGLGRTGYWFAADRVNVVPDMITIGKTLSGGMMPIAAVMYNDKIHQAELSIDLFINSTFSGNPLACSAALATLDFLEEEDILPRINEMSRIVVSNFDELVRDYPDILSHYDGVGLMRCLIARSFQHGFMLSTLLRQEHGIYLPAMLYNPTHLRVSPPFIASDNELKDFFAGVRAACQKIHDMGIPGMQQFFVNLHNMAMEAKQHG